MIEPVLLALSLASAAEAEVAPVVERAEVVAACVQTTRLPESREVSPEAVEAYCTCAMDELANVLTPAEFDLLARIGIARARNLPPPTEDEAAGIDREAFDARNNKAIARVRAQCNPILS